MFEEVKREFDKGMPVLTYVKKRYGFSSVEEFESYIAELHEKAQKWDGKQDSLGQP